MRVESCRELIFGLLFMGLFCAVFCEDEKPKKLQMGIKKRADNSLDIRSGPSLNLIHVSSVPVSCRFTSHDCLI